MNVAFRRVLAGGALLAGLFAAAGWGYAQGLIATQPVSPVVLSGGDIGFRMHGRQGATPIGELVVRIDGEWRRVKFGAGVSPVAK